MEVETNRVLIVERLVTWQKTAPSQEPKMERAVEEEAEEEVDVVQAAVFVILAGNQVISQGIVQRRDRV